MLIKRCYLKDIREYEDNTGQNILRLFDGFCISKLIKVMQIFIKGIDDKTACEMIDDYMESENKGIIEVYNEIRNALLGYDYLKESDEDDKSNIEDLKGSPEDVNTYDLLSDYYAHLCTQMMSLGLTYTEFWSFTTKEMYAVFRGLEQKSKIDFNKQMQINYISSGMFAGAVWGKMPDEAPHMELGRTDGKREEDIIINHPKYGEISRADLKAIEASDFDE